MSEKAADQSDLHRNGKALPDAQTNVRPIAIQVPRVMTVLDLLEGSRVRMSSEELREVPCTTGHFELDRITGGFRKGFSWLFGATTSWGKSSWLVMVVDENIRAGKRVLIVSSEDTDEVYGDRLLIRRAKVDALRFRNAKLLPYEMASVDRVVSKAEELPVYVDARRYPVEDLAPHLRKIIAEHKIDLVAFDYAQEFRSKRRFQDERIKLREIASVLRHIGKDAKIPSIIFSQLTTDENTRVPTRLNIRDCRDIANAAEVIVLGFEPTQNLEMAGVQVAHKGQKCIFVDKVKNGPRNRIVGMKWSYEGAYFETVEDPNREVPPDQQEMELQGEYDDRGYRA